MAKHKDRWDSAAQKDLFADTVIVMTREHPRWEEFARRMDGPEGAELTTDALGAARWTCSGTYAAATRILRELGFSEEDVAASAAAFAAAGARCDCEIVSHARDIGRTPTLSAAPSAPSRDGTPEAVPVVDLDGKTVH